MQARSTVEPIVTVEDAVVIAVAYPDDTPAFYAVPAANIAIWLEVWKSYDAIARPITCDEALTLQDNGAWIGIKIASAGWCAAWGHAKLTA